MSEKSIELPPGSHRERAITNGEMPVILFPPSAKKYSRVSFNSGLISLIWLPERTKLSMLGRLESGFILII